MATIDKAWSVSNIPSNSVSVKDFGIVPDGVTDNSSNFITACAAASTAGVPLYFPAGTYRFTANTVVSVAGDLTLISDGVVVIDSHKTDYNGTTSDSAFQFVISCDNFSMKGDFSFETSSSIPTAKYIKLKNADSVSVDSNNTVFKDVVYAIYCENCAGDFFFRFKVRDCRNSTGVVTVVHTTTPGRSANVETHIDYENAANSYTYSAGNYQQFLFCLYISGYSNSVPLGTVITNNKYKSVWGAYNGSTEPSMSGEQVDCASNWICNSTFIECGSAGPANADSGLTGGTCVIAGGVDEVVMNAVAHGVTFFMEAGDPKARGYEVKRLTVSDKCIVVHAREIGNSAYAGFSLGNSFEVAVTDTCNFNGTVVGFERGPLIRDCRLVRTAGMVDKPHKQYFHFVGCERMYINTLGQRGGYGTRDTSGTDHGAIRLTNNTAQTIFSRFLVVERGAYESMARHSTTSTFVTFAGSATNVCAVLGVPTDSTPTVGTYEQGQFVPRKTIAAAGQFGQYCVTSGSFENLTSVTVTKNSDNSNEYTVTAGLSQLYEGQYISVAGIATVQRIEFIDRTNSIIVTGFSTATPVTNAVVSTTDPTFKNSGNIAS